MGETEVAPRTASADHHHGDSETAIHVVSGHPVFVFVENGEEVRLTPEPGDYVYLRVTPTEIRAWREANELSGRLLMRDGVWLPLDAHR